VKEEDAKSSKKIPTFTEVFEKTFPYYLAIGMSADEFWHGDPSLVVGYREAYKMKQKSLNWQLWLQGLYIYDAVSVAISNAFGKKGSKKQDYFKEPISVFEKTEEEKELEAERARNKLIAQLNGWKARWDRKQQNKKD
jgi:hypothetical protein